MAKPSLVYKKKMTQKVTTAKPTTYKKIASKTATKGHSVVSPTEKGK